MLNALYRQLQHRTVRDLAWSLLSPSLFVQNQTDFSQRLIEDYIESPSELANWLLYIDQEPDSLNRFIQQRSQVRIGIYFEQLIGFYFKQHPRFELLEQNLQVHSNKQTLGEFDFIVYDNHMNQYLHIESAIKFYLNAYDHSRLEKNIEIYNWHQWIGPNKKDSLSIKMNNMLNKQLKLGETKEAYQKLLSHDIPAGKLQKRLLLRGRFFSQNNSQPQLANTATCQYSWLSLSLFSMTKKQTDQYLLLPRLYWLSPIQKKDIGSHLRVYNFKELMQVIEYEQKSGMSSWKLVVLDQQFCEAKRLFIISDI